MAANIPQSCCEIYMFDVRVIHIRNSSSTSPVRRILGKAQEDRRVCPALRAFVSTQLKRGLYQRVSSHVYTARRIGTAYPAPNPGRDKDKALYCWPIACGRRLSVYVCPPCNQHTSHRALRSSDHSRTARLPFVGCRHEGNWRPWGLAFSGILTSCSIEVFTARVI